MRMEKIFLISKPYCCSLHAFWSLEFDFYFIVFIYYLLANNVVLVYFGKTYIISNIIHTIPMTTSSCTCPGTNICRVNFSFGEHQKSKSFSLHVLLFKVNTYLCMLVFMDWNVAHSILEDNCSSWFCSSNLRHHQREKNVLRKY